MFTRLPCGTYIVLLYTLYDLIPFCAFRFPKEILQPLLLRQMSLQVQLDFVAATWTQSRTRKEVLAFAVRIIFVFIICELSRSISSISLRPDLPIYFGSLFQWQRRMYGSYRRSRNLRNWYASWRYHWLCTKLCSTKLLINVNDLAHYTL